MHGGLRLGESTAVPGTQYRLFGAQSGRAPTTHSWGRYASPGTAVLHTKYFSGRLDDDQFPLVLHRRHHRFVLGEERIHLAPHPELSRQIDPRLDREPDAGEEAAFFSRLQ